MKLFNLNEKNALIFKVKKKLPKKITVNITEDSAEIIRSNHDEK